MRERRAAPTRWTGNAAALLCTATLIIIAVTTQDAIAAVVTGIAAALTPMLADWARRHPEHRTQAWKVAVIAALYCAAWIAANATRYLRSVGPCDTHACALGAPVPLLMAALYTLPLALSIYQVSRLLAVRKQEA